MLTLNQSMPFMQQDLYYGPTHEEYEDLMFRGFYYLSNLDRMSPHFNFGYGAQIRSVINGECVYISKREGCFKLLEMLIHNLSLEQEEITQMFDNIMGFTPNPNQLNSRITRYSNTTRAMFIFGSTLVMPGFLYAMRSLLGQNVSIFFDYRILPVYLFMAVTTIGLMFIYLTIQFDFLHTPVNADTFAEIIDTGITAFNQRLSVLSITPHNEDADQMEEQNFTAFTKKMKTARRTVREEYRACPDMATLGTLKEFLDCFKSIQDAAPTIPNSTLSYTA